MGGIERQFSDALPGSRTYIGMHGPADRATGQLLPTQAPQIYALYKLRIGDKFNKSIMNTALYDMRNRGSLLYAYDPVRNSKDKLFHCVESGMPRAECTHYEGEDAFTLGVITSKDLVKVTLPDALKPKSAAASQ